MSAYADCLKTLALRVRVCIASDFDAVGNLQLWDAPFHLTFNLFLSPLCVAFIKENRIKDYLANREFPRLQKILAHTGTSTS